MDLVVDQVDLVVEMVEIPRGRRRAAVDQKEVILRDRRPKDQLMVALPMSQKSRYPEGKPTRSELPILTVGCLTALPMFSARVQIRITKNGSVGPIQHLDQIQTSRA